MQLNIVHIFLSLIVLKSLFLTRLNEAECALQILFGVKLLKYHFNIFKEFVPII